jgi:hypothetical protein
MSTAKPRKTSPRGTARKPANADGAASTESPIGDARAIDEVLSTGASIENTPAVDLPSMDFRPDEAEQEIRIRAYELYLSRGGADGDDLSDWLEAERIVRSSQRSNDEPRENRSSPPA